jgi:RsiW-degrading membrane proteinase PrsW (M82 family)
MQTILEILVSILPVFIFLAFLLLFDSFKLVKWRNIIVTIGIGSAAAMLCLMISIFLLSGLQIPTGILTRYIAPVIEEGAKAGYIIFLLRSRKIGFMVDGAIYGFAVGAGFAVIENIYYLHSLENKQLIVWVIRGLGTAVMHGGTTAVFTIISKNLEDRLRKHTGISLLPGFIAAVIIHSFFNHFFLRPAIMTMGQLIILPILVTLVYIRSEKHLRSWLEIGLDTDVSILEYITSGRLSETRIGRYLQSIMNQFPGEIMADMLCYLRIYLELSICAKGALLMQESGFKIPRDREIEDKIRELNYLEKSIGQTGKRAIAPLVQKSARDMWQIYLLS